MESIPISRNLIQWEGGSKNCQNPHVHNGRPLTYSMRLEIFTARTSRMQVTKFVSILIALQKWGVKQLRETNILTEIFKVNGYADLSAMTLTFKDPGQKTTIFLPITIEKLIPNFPFFALCPSTKWLGIPISVKFQISVSHTCLTILFFIP